MTIILELFNYYLLFYLYITRLLLLLIWTGEGIPRAPKMTTLEAAVAPVTCPTCLQRSLGTRWGCHASLMKTWVSYLVLGGWLQNMNINIYICTYIYICVHIDRYIYIYIHIYIYIQSIDVWIPTMGWMTIPQPCHVLTLAHVTDDWLVLLHLLQCTVHVGFRWCLSASFLSSDWKNILSCSSI